MKNFDFIGYFFVTKDHLNDQIVPYDMKTARYSNYLSTEFLCYIKNKMNVV